MCLRVQKRFYVIAIAMLIRIGQDFIDVATLHNPTDSRNSNKCCVNFNSASKIVISSRRAMYEIEKSTLIDRSV